jgi:hypothetical protein
MYLGRMTDRHMGIKTLLMQNLDSAHYLSVLQIVRAMRYLSAYKGAATMLLLPICLSVCSMNGIFGLMNRFQTDPLPSPIEPAELSP